MIYSVTDSNSNVTVVIRTITVTNAPTIFGADNKSINPGSSFNPLEGISASDKEDGANLSVEIISNTVNTTTPGTYEVVYKTVDSDGNATIATRVIVVTNAPTINTPGNESVNIGEVFDPLSGVTALDEEDGSIATIIVDGSVDTSKSGDYVLTYTVVDSDGNETSVTRIITVMSKPTILLPGDNTINKNSSFDPLQGVSATDKEDGNLTSKIEVIENNVNTSRAGEYTVAYRVVDSHGNVFEIIRTVTVVIPNY